MSGHKIDNYEAPGNLKHPQRFASDYHAPVLCNAVVKGLIIHRNGTYVDGTLGGGGHAEAILDVLTDDGRLIGLDRDDDAIRTVGKRLAADVESGRLSIIKGNFGDLTGLLHRSGIHEIDGLLLDLGVSSHQLDEAERGFSHRLGGPLDMRMDTDEAEDAAAILNSWEEADIVAVIRRYGEEPRARRIAHAIISNRPLESTSELADIVRQAVPANQVGKALARVFQAIRIAVNNELEALERALADAVELLKIGGRIAVISYHSLEDRRVKRFFRSGNLDGIVRRDLYGNKVSPVQEVSAKPIVPDSEEVDVNPRARSARLRFAERVSTAKIAFENR